MKKTALLILALALSLPGQTKNPVQDDNELVWCGIDYTLVKFIGTPEQFTDLHKIRTYYFRTWNMLILNEKSKYDLNKAFSVATVEYNMENSSSRSEQRSMDGIVQTNPYTIDEEQVKNVVQTNIDPSADKIGAMFVMETLNKTAEVSTMWLAVFKVASGEILYLRRYSGDVGGFGFRNYYARSLYEVIKNLEMSPRNPE